MSNKIKIIKKINKKTYNKKITKKINKNIKNKKRQKNGLSYNYVSIYRKKPIIYFYMVFTYNFIF